MTESLFGRMIFGIVPKRFRSKIILLVFCLVSCSIIFAGVLFYTRSTSLIYAQSNMYIRNLCINLMRDIDSNLIEMERVCRNIIGNPEIHNILVRRRSEEYTDYQYILDQRTIMNIILGFISVRDSFIIQLFDGNGNSIYADPDQFISYNQSLFENRWVAARKSEIDNQRFFIVTAIHSGLTLFSRHQAFYVIRPIKLIRNNEILGYITICADNESFADILRRYSLSLGDADIRVISEEEEILLSLTPEEIGTFYQNQADDNSVLFTSEFTSWRTEIHPRDIYGREDLTKIGFYAMLIIIITMTASILFTYLFVVFLTRPLQNLAQGMIRVGKGEFDFSLDEEIVDRDLRQIFLGFNTMVAEIRNLIRTVHEERLLVKSAQLEALQYQINPHFLYNTFQTIESIGEVREVEEIRIIAQSLGKLFRYNTKGTSEVYLYEEIDQMDTYLNIENIRFGDRITWAFNIPGEVRECRILKFILQPLIENAIVHGFRSNMLKGIVSISAVYTEPDLEITIGDSGIGMDDKTYGDLCGALSLTTKNRSFRTSPDEKFIGILNVQRRITNFYGPQYGLSYSRNIEGMAVVAKLFLPALFFNKIEPA